MKPLFKIIYISCVFTIVLSTFYSCSASRESMAYFQDEPLTEEFVSTNKHEIRYKPNDVLTIDVTAIDPATVAPFNLPAVSRTNSVAEANNGGLRMQTYLIDYDGNIDFPVLGEVKLGGLTRKEATKLMTDKISEYVNDPIIIIRLINFTVTVLGEVNKPGTFTVEDERISLSEALGLAGDLTIYGVRENVFLIREIDGIKRYAKIDLTSINTVNSPNYYLSQNDVLYVEPNKARMRSSNFTQNNGVIIAALGTLASITAIIISLR